LSAGGFVRISALTTFTANGRHKPLLAPAVRNEIEELNNCSVVLDGSRKIGGNRRRRGHHR